MDDALALLVLPGKLEQFELQRHARELLAIPRVVALEPSRLRPPRILREAICMRQARKLRFPGRLALLALYDPAQYPLARALWARHEGAELWYVAPDAESSPSAGDRRAEELADFDGLARHHAVRTLQRSELDGDDSPLRRRLRELDVISPYAFMPAPGTKVR